MNASLWNYVQKVRPECLNFMKDPFYAQNTYEKKNKFFIFNDFWFVDGITEECNNEQIFLKFCVCDLR